MKPSPLDRDLFAENFLTLRVVFTGRVQGVGFRYCVKELAKGFEVVGSVKNLPDHTVEVIVQGEPHEVRAFTHEITTESEVAHHIKTTHEEVLTLPTSPLLDFRILS